MPAAPALFYDGTGLRPAVAGWPIVPVTDGGEDLGVSGRAWRRLRLTGQAFVAGGGAAAPGYSSAADPDTGMQPLSDDLRMSVGGVYRARFITAGLQMADVGELGWSPGVVGAGANDTKLTRISADRLGIPSTFQENGGGDITFYRSGLASFRAGSSIFSIAQSLGISATNGVATPDIKLERDAADTLAQRRGVNPQAFRVYNTYTDGSNYERGFARWESNIFKIGTEFLGIGTEKNMEVWLNGASRWVFAANGNFRPTGAHDVGSIGNPVKALYLGGVDQGILTIKQAATPSATSYPIQIQDSTGTKVAWFTTAGEFYLLNGTGALGITKSGAGTRILADTGLFLNGYNGNLSLDTNSGGTPGSAKNITFNSAVIRPLTDAALDFGVSTYRWRTFYGGGADLPSFIDKAPAAPTLNRAEWQDSLGAVKASMSAAWDFDIAGVYKVAASQVVGARKTGWTLPTGTPSRAGFATSTATLTQVAETLMALLTDLHATAGHGLIGG